MNGWLFIYPSLTVSFSLQKEYGVNTSPFIMKDLSLCTLHLPNHNGSGAQPEFWMFLNKISIPLSRLGKLVSRKTPFPCPSYKIESFI